MRVSMRSLENFESGDYAARDKEHPVGEVAGSMLRQHCASGEESESVGVQASESVQGAFRAYTLLVCPFALLFQGKVRGGQSEEVFAGDSETVRLSTLHTRSGSSQKCLHSLELNLRPRRSSAGRNSSTILNSDSSRFASSSPASVMAPSMRRNEEQMRAEEITNTRKTS